MKNTSLSSCDKSLNKKYYRIDLLKNTITISSIGFVIIQILTCTIDKYVSYNKSNDKELLTKVLSVGFGENDIWYGEYMSHLERNEVALERANYLANYYLKVYGASDSHRHFIVNETLKLMMEGYLCYEKSYQISDKEYETFINEVLIPKNGYYFLTVM